MTGWCGAPKPSSFALRQDRLRCVLCSRAPHGNRPSAGLLKSHSHLASSLSLLFIPHSLIGFSWKAFVNKSLIQILGSVPASTRTTPMKFADCLGDENGIHTCKQLQIPKKLLEITTWHCMLAKVLCFFLVKTVKRGSGPWGRRSLLIAVAFSWACVL